MKRSTMIAATAVFALTAVMLFAGVVNAQQPVTATAQYKDYGYWGGHPGWGGYGHWWGGHPGWGHWGGYHHWR
ncbi:MAG: hypothetical protein WCE81_02780 [Halobacteriota archaeon]